MIESDGYEFSKATNLTAFKFNLIIIKWNFNTQYWKYNICSIWEIKEKLRI